LAGGSEKNIRRIADTSLWDEPIRAGVPLIPISAVFDVSITVLS
jgi:hypothetical protein